MVGCPPSTGRSLRAGNSSKHLSREPREKNSDQLKVPTRERETATHTGEDLCSRLLGKSKYVKRVIVWRRKQVDVCVGGMCRDHLFGGGGKWRGDV